MATKRLNVNVPEDVYEELQQLSKETGRSITEIVRTAFGLVKVAYEETGEQKKQKLVVMGDEGKPVKELIMPR